MREQKSIVVVEDDDSILQLMQDIFREEGYETVGVRQPDRVLEAAFRQRPDVFLIDIMLPKSSGIEVADKLWLNGFAEVPMIAISASPTMRDLARHTALFQETLDKPFDLSNLLDVVERVTTRSLAQHTGPA